ncbi:MAG TPA: biosynthetic peptidoglycan transglycosylase, partial [Anaeromyxobacteraceae bacterium]|nr:biosynthetic peptidoglycan transglycosylase [Anaeromyxobacteraceae bacterium]
VLGGRPDAPLLRADRVVVRPRLASLLGGRVEPAAVALRGLVLDPARDGGLGPVDAFVALEPGGGGASGQVVLARGGHLDAMVSREPGGLSFRVEGSLTLPDDLPPRFRERLPFSFASGRIALSASGRSATGGDGAEADVDLRATDLAVDGPRAGPSPLGPLSAGLSGRVTWNGRDRRVALAWGRFTLGDDGRVAAEGTASLVLRGDRPFSVSLRARDVPWRALVDALPEDLGPPPTAPPVSGALSARASVTGALDRREQWDVQVDLDLDDLRRAARAAGPGWLSGGFEWTPIDPAPGEPRRRIAVGPGNPDFVPYAEIPPALVRAVTASEDAGFFGHRGFDFREIANAVADRSRVRGASTISQQLAKNLFLSPERTFARKVREALGTIALEATLPKARLLEIYLNIAEWGPGVYGVGEAARFWFGKDVRDLTVRESAFLATVIPSPRRFHARLVKQGVTPWWNARIDDVLGKMRVQGQLTDAQLEAALAEPIAPLGMAAAPFANGPDAHPDAAPGDADDDGYLSR